MAAQPKHTIPKDASVIMSIMKDMGILEYESRVVNQLLEFTYRYVTCILDDSRVYANHAKKKGIDLDDTKLAISLISERSFTTPPHRDLLLDIARTKNTLPLPLIKPHCGIRLPPDRYCLLSCNYRMLPKKQPQVVMSRGGMGYSAIGGKMIASKGQVGQMAIVKRPGTLTSISRTLPVTGSKPVIKFSTGMNVPKLITKPKIQVQAPIAVKIESEPSNDLKRKRDDDSFEGDYLDHLKQRKINE